MSQAGRDWECHKCTYTNGSSLSNCEMCGSDRSAAPRAQPGGRTRGRGRGGPTRRASTDSAAATTTTAVVGKAASRGLSKLASDRRSRALVSAAEKPAGGTPSRVSHSVQQALEAERQKAEQRARQEAELIQRRMQEEMERSAAKLEEAKSALSAQRQAMTASQLGESEVRVLSSHSRRELQQQRIAAFRQSEKLREDEYIKRTGGASSSGGRPPRRAHSSELPFEPETDLDEKVLHVYMSRGAGAAVGQKRAPPKVPLRKLSVGKYLFGTQVIRVSADATDHLVAVLPSAASLNFSTALDQMEPVEAKKLQAMSAARGIVVF